MTNVGYQKMYIGIDQYKVGLGNKNTCTRENVGKKKRSIKNSKNKRRTGKGLSLATRKLAEMD